MAYGQNTMMAMLDAKAQEQQQQQMQKNPSGGGEYWNDVNDPDLSPIRKHLISSYLQVSDEEAMPLLGEYFGVALSFVALGALVRASNSTTAKRKQQQQRRASATTTDEAESLDLRACSRFQRMALESMLKESMERLRVLSQNAYQLEDKVKHLEKENFAQDRGRVHLLNRVMEAEKAVQELRALRKAEGRANERVMGIVATKEQDWIKEKRSLQKEAEKLKETVRAMNKEAKFHARRCTNLICEHCQGIERIARSTSKGGGAGSSLRDLHSPRDCQSSASKHQVLLKAEHQQQQQRHQTGSAFKADTYLEDEEDKIILKAIEMKKNVCEKPGSLKTQQLNGEKRYTDWCAADDPGNENYRSQFRRGASSSGSGQSPAIQEGLMKQQQNMESELANILKRVGMLRQRSYSTVGVLGISPKKEEPSGARGSSRSLLSDDAEDLEPLSFHTKGKDLSKLALVEEDSSQIVVHAELTKRSMTIPEPSALDPTFEITEYAYEHSHNSDELKDVNDVGDLDLDVEEGEDEEVVETRSSPRQDSMPVRDECAHEIVADDEMVAGVGAEKLQTEQEELLEGVGNFAGNDGSDERGLGGSKEYNSNRGDATDAEQSLLQVDQGEEGRSAFLNGLHDEECIQNGEGKEDSATSESSRGDHGADSTPQGRGDYRSEEHKQMLEVIEGRDNNEALSPPSNFTNRSTPFSPDSDATRMTGDRVDEPSAAADATSSISSNAASQLPHLVEGQEDIPFFERKNSDDLAGELPEPEEKRVCGSDEPFDSSDASPATATATVSTPALVKSINEESKTVEQMNDNGVRGTAPVSNHKKTASVMDDDEEKEQATLSKNAVIAAAAASGDDIVVDTKTIKMGNDPMIVP